MAAEVEVGDWLDEGTQMTDNGRTTSVWMGATETRDESPLLLDAHADVCIVGAGIAGLTTAYLLSQEGKRAIVVDDGPTAGGETCRTTAHLVERAGRSLLSARTLAR